MVDKKEDSNDWKVRLKSIVLSLPEKPGSYQYLDEEGTIIYVGKAKNLKRRALISTRTKTGKRLCWSAKSETYII